jgi:ferredoxin
MTTRVVRKIVKIDEEKCNGCGACVPACAEGALQIIDGKARLVGEVYCDGLGACLGECPQDAISVEEREAEEFDEATVERRLHELSEPMQEAQCGCPGAAVAQFDRRGVAEHQSAPSAPQPSMLGHWPVQLTLVPPGAPFLQGADVVLVADCVPFAYAGFHRDFLKDRAVLVACPKLDDFQAHLVRLIRILRQSDIRSLTVVHMEVPCCSGLVEMAKRAVAASGKDVPLSEVAVGTGGELLG